MHGTVPIPWVGHSDCRGQRPDQQDADHQSSQEGDCHWCTQTPLDLRRCYTSNTHTHRHTHSKPFWRCFSHGVESFFTATLHCGVHHAQAGDCGLPEEIQCQEETQGERRPFFFSFLSAFRKLPACIKDQWSIPSLCLPRVPSWLPCWPLVTSQVKPNQFSLITFYPNCVPKATLLPLSF